MTVPCGTLVLTCSWIVRVALQREFSIHFAHLNNPKTITIMLNKWNRRYSSLYGLCMSDLSEKYTNLLWPWNQFFFSHHKYSVASTWGIICQTRRWELCKQRYSMPYPMPQKNSMNIAHQMSRTITVTSSTQSRRWQARWRPAQGQPRARAARAYAAAVVAASRRGWARPSAGAAGSSLGDWPDWPSLLPDAGANSRTRWPRAMAACRLNQGSSCSGTSVTTCPRHSAVTVWRRDSDEWDWHGLEGLEET